MKDIKWLYQDFNSYINRLKSNNKIEFYNNLKEWLKINSNSFHNQIKEETKLNHLLILDPKNYSTEFSLQNVKQCISHVSYFKNFTNNDQLLKFITSILVGLIIYNIDKKCPNCFEGETFEAWFDENEKKVVLLCEICGNDENHKINVSDKNIIPATLLQVKEAGLLNEP